MIDIGLNIIEATPTAISKWMRENMDKDFEITEKDRLELIKFYEKFLEEQQQIITHTKALLVRLKSNVSEPSNKSKNLQAEDM